jgi:hypothetical protein
MKTIRRGHMGQEVLVWQGILGIGESGHFDEETESATMAWQRMRGLEPDGVVGPRTWGVAGFVQGHTEDLDDDFFRDLVRVAYDLSTPSSEVKPRDMLAVMKSESNISATAHNDNPKSLPPEKRWNASGLIQFMPPTLAGLGWTQGHTAFRTLTATQQLAYVRRYYTPYRGHLHTVGGLYVATFLPALVKHASNPAFVLTAENGPLPWAYSPNAAFDTNRDKAITVGELEAAVARACVGPRWEEALRRLNDASPTLPSLHPSAPDNEASEPTIHVEPDIVHPRHFDADWTRPIAIEDDDEAD